MISRIHQMLFGPIVAGVLSVATPVRAEFMAGDLFISSSLTDEVRIYDSTTLTFTSSFSHPEFGNPVSGSYAAGPNGMAFNARGNLVVAAFNYFVEFSAPGVQFGSLHAKQTVEPNETLLFDRLGNLYTTTSTGGSNQLNQYDSDFVFKQSIMLPSSAGSLTGITFDDKDRLFVASQNDNTIYVLQGNATLTTFTASHTIAGANASHLEGLQINQNGELVAAGGNISRYNPESGVVLGSFDAVPDNDVYPVALTVDNLGNIFTADYEDGFGTISADIYRFAPDGSSFIWINDPDLFGPFGLAIAGTVLPGGPSAPGGSIPTPSTVALFGLGLAGLGFSKWRKSKGQGSLNLADIQSAAYLNGAYMCTVCFELDVGAELKIGRLGLRQRQFLSGEKGGVSPWESIFFALGRYGNERSTNRLRLAISLFRDHPTSTRDT
jgi:streptogramin lyase